MEAFASMEIRRVLGLLSASVLICPSSSKMADVSGMVVLFCKGRRKKEGEK
jgi:hypothetical protein